eukprot:gene13588-biopygen886
MAMGDLLDTLELRCDEIRSIPFHLRTAQPREPAGHSLLRAAIHELQLSDDGTLRRTAVPAVFPTIAAPNADCAAYADDLSLWVTSRVLIWRPPPLKFFCGILWSGGRNGM